MKLPGPDSVYELKITLPLIAAVEKEQGGLYLMAEKLLEGALPLSQTIGALKIIYRHADCKEAEEILDAYLLQQPCSDLLAEVLVEILEPMEKLGALPLGEAPAGKELT
jgi:hypothetical protein